MTYPKLAAPNLFHDINTLKSFVMDNGFQGIDWTLRQEDLPTNRVEEARLSKDILKLAPLEIRYHLFFLNNELGDIHDERAGSAKQRFYEALDLISKLSGRHATVHIGLGRDSMQGVSWDRTVVGLKDLVAKARRMGIRLCLENLISGWTGEPELYEKLIRKTNCKGTLDIGHAHVCQAVTSRAYDVDDFALPHPERILNAHIYHEETANVHIPPKNVSDFEDRLLLLERLPLCDWWVLELREEKALLQTLDCVREFLQSRRDRIAM